MTKGEVHEWFRLFHAAQTKDLESHGSHGGGSHAGVGQRLV